MGDHPIEKTAMFQLELMNQLERTIQSLKEKTIDPPEPMVCEYLDHYRAAFTILNRSTDFSLIHPYLCQLLNGARGYMETSSDYQQRFLQDMAETEKLIRACQKE